MAPLSAYLSRLEAFCPLTPLDTATRGPPSPPSDCDPLSSASPAKRPRSDSPDTSAASSPSTPATSLFGPSSGICLSPIASTSFTTCIRSILSPSSSPPPSRALSRRSSTGCSSKSVRFARCTNASVFPALSGEEYDRTPIVPTCESESLNLPKRDCDGTEGWIKCVERARVAEKERKAAAAAAIEAGESPEPFRLTTTSHKVVEGVHGLVGGGYFVGGEERDSFSMSSDEEEFADDEDVSHGAEGDDDMVVDDEEDGGDEAPAPALIPDDSSDESDSVPSVQSDAPIPVRAASPPRPSADFSLSSTPSPTPEEPSAGEVAQAVAVAAAAAAELEVKRKNRERYGICALGKYSRAEVYQSYDSLGGF